MPRWTAPGRNTVAVKLPEKKGGRFPNSSTSAGKSRRECPDRSWRFIPEYPGRVRTYSRRRGNRLWYRNSDGEFLAIETNERNSMHLLLSPVLSTVVVVVGSPLAQLGLLIVIVVLVFWHRHQ
jgi:hypothetical protein